MDTMARLFLCACCRAQALICSNCDRGQMYCSEVCSQSVRRTAIREAGRRYQTGRNGRLNHAKRMRRYRAKKEKVTHHGSLPPSGNALLISDSAANATAALPAGKASTIPAWHCHFCRSACSEFVRTRFLCGRPVQTRPRQGALRRGDDGGHSP